MVNRIRLHIALLWIIALASCQERITESHSLTLQSGTVDRIEDFNSKYVIPRNIDIWLPEDYTDTQQYSVIYMHDGQMLFDSTQTWNGQEWGVDDALGRLLEEQAIQKVIVVGIWNTENRWSEYLPQKVFDSLTELDQKNMLSSKGPEGNLLFGPKIISDNYLKHIVEEVKPFVDKRYSTHPDRKHTYIAGSSMGAMISWYALMEYPDVFGGAACLSTHWTGSFQLIGNPFPNACAEYIGDHLPSQLESKMYFDYGTETLDSYYEPFQKHVDSTIKAIEFNGDWISKRFEGADHSERSWMNRLEHPVLFLVSK